MYKTAIECWNILKYEIESINEKNFPLKIQGKRFRKKHLSKEAMWRVYRLTRKDEDYAHYKEALNLATYGLFCYGIDTANLKEPLKTNWQVI